jgi:hypothetical protein
MSRPLLQDVSGLGTTRGVSPDDQQHKLKQWPRRHILFSDHVLTQGESNKIRGFIISSLSDTCINWDLFFQDRTIKRFIRVLQLPCGCSRRHKILGEPPPPWLCRHCFQELLLHLYLLRHLLEFRKSWGLIYNDAASCD